MKSERLLTIILHLQAKGRASAAQLARRLEVSERTVHRDMESLAASGIPVYAERGRAGGWCLSEGYRTNLTGMKKNELRALFLAYSTQALTGLGMTGDFESAFLKLLAALPPGFRQDVERIRDRIYLASPGWQAEPSALLPQLHLAVEQCRTVIVDYERKGVCKKRTVDPLGLVARGSVWYLVSREGSRYRTFRVSNLKKAVTAGPIFQRPTEFDLRSYWHQWWKEYERSLPVFMVLLRMSEEVLERVRCFPFARILRASSPKNGRVTVKMDLETIEWATQIVLWMGAGATVLRPASLRKAVGGAARGIVEQYASAIGNSR